MSIFTSQVTKALTVPGGTITVRKLAPRHLEAAAKESQRRAIEDLKAIGGMKALKELKADVDAEADEAEPKPDEKPNPLVMFDHVSVMRSGIVSWTFGDVTDELIESIDAETAEMLVTEILQLSKPQLFMSQNDAEADRKNG